MEIFWQWLFGGALVFLYAFNRFNTPASNRFSTTTGRYYFSLTLYLLALWLLFLLLGAALTDYPKLVNLFDPAGASQDTAQKLPGPLYSALLLTTLLPSTRLSKFDQWLREVSWDIGNIPRAARLLSAQLRQGRFIVPTVFREEVRQRLAGFKEDNIVFEPDESLQHKWTRLASLCVIIKDWKEQDVPKRSPEYDLGENWSEDQIDEWARYDKIPTKLAEDYKKIQRCFNQLRPKAYEYFERARRENVASSMVSGYAETLDGMFEDLHKIATQFLARGVLRVGDTDENRLKRLTELGFVDVVRIEKDVLTANQIVGIGLGIFAILMSVLVGAKFICKLFGTMLPPGYESTIRNAISVAPMVAVIYGLAVVAAIYPKTFWRSFDRRRKYDRHWLAYLASGIFAVILGGMIALTYRFLLLGDFVEALRSFYWEMPWYSLCFVTGFAIAFLSDDYLRHQKAPVWLPWLESVLMAGVLVLVAAKIVYPWLVEIQTLKTHPAWVGVNECPKMFQRPPLSVLLIGTGCIGVLLGFVPGWYRRALRKDVKAVSKGQECETAADPSRLVPTDSQDGKNNNEQVLVHTRRILRDTGLTGRNAANASS